MCCRHLAGGTFHLRQQTELVHEGFGQEFFTKTFFRFTFFIGQRAAFGQCGLDCLRQILGGGCVISSDVGGVRQWVAVYHFGDGAGLAGDHYAFEEARFQCGSAEAFFHAGGADDDVVLGN